MKKFKQFRTTQFLNFSIICVKCPPLCFSTLSKRTTTTTVATTTTSVVAESDCGALPLLVRPMSKNDNNKYVKIKSISHTHAHTDTHIHTIRSRTRQHITHTRAHIGASAN